MNEVGPTGRRGGGRRRMVTGAVALLIALPAFNILTESLAAAATPALVQSAAGQNSSSSLNSIINLSATLGSTCTAGDTLIAMITIGQQNDAGGMVSVTPPGWRRLFEHSPVDTSPYQGWFALSNCGGVSTVTFSVTARGDSSGTAAGIVLDEFSGLPNPVTEDVSNNGGSSSSLSNETLSAPTPSASGELTLTALSFYGGSSSSSTPTGWASAGSETSTALPAFDYWKVGNSSAPSATFNWSPSSAFEVTMLSLKAGPANPAPNVVQENQGGFSGQSSWAVTLPGPVSAGDSLIAMVGTNASASTGAGFEANSVSGGGVTWQQVTGYRQSGNGTAEIWVGFASAGTSGATPVTASMSGSLSGEMVVSEVSNISSIDASSAAHGTASTDTASSITPHAGDILVGMLTANPTLLVTHPMPNWSTFSLADGSYGAEWLTNAAAVASAPQWSTTSSGNYVALQAAFTVKAAGTSSTITSVGSFSSKVGTGLSTLAVSPQNVGDVLAVFAERSTTGTLTSVSGGGVSTWTKGVQFAGSVGADEEIWTGKVTSTGSSTITFTWSGTVTGFYEEYGVQEFSAGLGANTAWALDKSGTVNGASSTTVPFPSLTPSGPGELYFGYTVPANVATAGSTSGFTYDVTAEKNLVTFDTNVTGAVSPTGAQSPASTSSSIAVLLTASSSVGPVLPTVSGISPTSGPTAGGTSVVITGTNLSGATAVKFGSATGAVTADTATSITVTSPAGTGTVDVTVTTPGGTSTTSPADQFTYVAPSLPTVSGISPTSGPTAGGTSVVITGTNLSGATAVKFGSATGAVTADTATSITVTSPAGTGTVDVTVTTPGGTSTTSPADQFTYVAPSLPTVSGISPTSGPTAGGTSVVITGTNLSGATAVKFGSATGAVTADTATSITVTSPAGTGTVDVTVTTPGGTSTTSGADRFTYTASSGGASITSVGSFSSKVGTGLSTLAVSPQNVGDVLAVFAERSTTGTLTSVSGGGVSTWTKGVQFAGSVGADEEIWTGKVTSTGSSTITFTWSGTVTGFYEEYGVQEFSAGLGANTAWALDKSGTVNGASSTTVPFPSLTPSGPGELYFGYTVPANVATAGSTSGFTYDVTAEKNLVTFDTNVTGAVSPTGAQSPASTSSSIAVLLTASSSVGPVLPTVSGISPTSGPTAGGTSVVITGTNLSGATAVKFGSATGAVTADTATSITVTSPAGTGTVDVTVTTPGGTSTTSPADQFTYVAPSLPTVSGISPTSGPTAGGTSVVITGTNLSGATAVKFGSATGAVTADTATSITVTSPAGTGTVDVTVTTPGGTSTTSPADQFTYVAPSLPTVSGISPTSGPTAGGTSVVITGTNLSGATAVKFGSATGAVTADTATSITVTSPAGTGTVDVTVTTPAGRAPRAPPTSSPTWLRAFPPSRDQPHLGPDGRGTSVVITGTNLSGATAVKFGSATGAVTADTATSITVTSPAGTGTVDVTVTTPGGTSTTSGADRFTYTASSGGASITSVGTTAGAAAKGISTLAVSPKQLGDLLVLLVKVDSSTLKATSVSGGGVGSWTLAATYAGYANRQFSIWTGVVTSTGSATITVGFSGSVSAVEVGLEGQEFTSSLGTSTAWGVDTSGGISNPSGSTTTFASLTPTGTGELYLGFNSVFQANATAGSTPGFTYVVTPDGDIVAYDTAVSSTVQPTAHENPAGVSGGIGVLITASS